MTPLYFRAVFARAMRRSQVAYGLTSFARRRCSVVVGTSIGQIGGVTVGKVIVVALARTLGKTLVVSVARSHFARWKMAPGQIVGDGTSASDVVV